MSGKAFIQRKPVIAVIALIASWAALSLSACGQIFGEKSKSKPAQVTVETDCLTTSKSELKNWVSAKSGDVGAAIDCTLKTTSKFLERVQFEGSEGWSAPEIAELFADKSGSQNSDSLKQVQLLFKIKQIIVGGSRDHITRDEIKSLQGLLGRLRPALVELTPSIENVILEKDQVSSEDTETTNRRLNRVAEIIATSIETDGKSRPDLSIDELRDLAVDLGLDREKAEPWMPLLKSAKSLLAGGGELHIEGERWPRLLRAGANAWGIFLRAKLSLVKSDDLLGRDFDAFSRLISSGLQEASLALRAQGGGETIGFDRLMILAERLDERKLLPFDLKASTVKTLLSPALGKILYGRWHDDWQDKTRGLTSVQIGVFRVVFEDWAAAQKELLGWSASGRPTAAPWSASGADDKAYRQQLWDLLTQGRKLVLDSSDRVWLGPEDKTPERTLADYNRLNLTRAVSSLMITGYLRDIANASKGLSTEEVQELYADIRQLGIDMGIIDFRNTTAGQRSFMEASLFTSTATGSSRVSVHQAVEWFTIAFGAQKSAHLFYESLVDSCGVEDRDPRGNRKLEIACFRKALSADFEKLFPNLMALTAWVGADREKRLEQVLNAVEASARSVGVSKLPLEPTDARSMFPILYYAENLITTRDKDGNGILDDREVRAYFPVIRPFIQMVGGGAANSEFVQRAIFHYMLVNGTPPPDGTVGILKLALAGVSQKYVEERADRLDILKIMAGFSIHSRRDRAKKIGEFYNEQKENLGRAFSNSDPQVIEKMTAMFQCQPQVKEQVAELLRTHVWEILKKNADAEWPDPAAFIARIKSLLAAKPEFARWCLPF